MSVYLYMHHTLIHGEWGHSSKQLWFQQWIEVQNPDLFWEPSDLQQNGSKDFFTWQ